MYSLDITSDLNEAMAEIADFFWKDVPFAMSQAMNDSMFDARRRIVNSTYPRAFNVRNKVLPGRLWRITKRASKRDLEVLLTQTMDLDYMVRHVTGGVKTPRGGKSVAIPVDISRTKTGRIPAARKPTPIRNKKGTFVRPGKGGTRVVVERQRNKTLRVWYILAPSAKIDARFRFYEDGIDTIERVFSGHFNTRMNRAIATSRFT